MVGEVSWSEGLFLHPHHFQAEQRHAAYRDRLGVTCGRPFDWGIRSIAFDPDALAGGTLVVRQLLARLPDGTIIDVPGKEPLDPFEFAGFVNGDRPLVLELAVPRLSPRGPNLGTGKAGPADTAAAPGPCRFAVTRVEDVPDENTGAGPYPIDLRHLNVRIMAASQDMAAFDRLPLLAVRAAEPPLFELDPDFVPPLLACGGWKPLCDQTLARLRGAVRNRVGRIAEAVRERCLDIHSPAPEDAQLTQPLGLLNEACATLEVMFGVPELHPFDAYVEVARLVGRLALYGPDRAAPKIAAYNHRDLGKCFGAAVADLRRLLDHVGDFKYEEIRFTGALPQLTASVALADLDDPRWQFYLGVIAPQLDEGECRRLLAHEALGLKLAAPRRVDTVFTDQQEGVRYEPAGPRGTPLPAVKGRHYFRLDRDGDEFRHCLVARHVGLRVTSNLLVEAAAGGGPATRVSFRGRTVEVTFRLYAHLEDRGGADPPAV